MPINNYEPNLGQAVSGGFSTGMQWAQAQQQNRYHQEELKRQYAALQSQDAAHKLKIMDKVSDYMSTLATIPTDQRSKYFRIAEAQSKMMGIDISAWKPVINDPTFQIDVAGPLKQIISGMKNQSPDQISQGFVKFNAGMRDPIMARQVLSDSLRSINTQQAQATRQGFQQSKSDDQMFRDYAKWQDDYNKSQGGVVGQAAKVQWAAGRIEALLNGKDPNEFKGSQIHELAIAYNTLVSNSNRQNVQTYEAIVPKSLWGDVSKIEDYFTGQAHDTNMGGLAQVLLQGTEREKDFAKGVLDDFHAKQAAVWGDMGFAQRNPERFDRINKHIFGIPQDQDFKKTIQERKDQKAASQNQPMNAPSLTPDQTNQVIDGVKKFKASGLSDDEIKQHLTGGFGRDFSPEELKKFGLQIKAPAAAQPQQGQQQPASPLLPPSQPQQQQMPPDQSLRNAPLNEPPVPQPDQNYEENQ